MFVLLLSKLRNVTSCCKIGLLLLMANTSLQYCIHQMRCCSHELLQSCCLCCFDEGSAMPPWPESLLPTLPCYFLSPPVQILMMRILPHLQTPSAPSGPTVPIAALTRLPPPLCLPTSKWASLHTGDSMRGSSSGAFGTAATKAEPGDSTPHGVPQEGAAPPLPACGSSSPGQAHAAVHRPPPLPQPPSHQECVRTGLSGGAACAGLARSRSFLTWVWWCSPHAISCCKGKLCLRHHHAPHTLEL